MTELSNSLQTLKTEGVAMMPYNPELREKVVNAAALWKAFCGLSLEEKRQYGANTDSAGTGYEYKDGVGAHADRKENFDIAPVHQAHIDSLLSQGNDATAHEFITAAANITKDMQTLAVEFARQAEAEFNIPGFAETVEASRDNVFVRFLHYFGDRVPGGLIAEPHTDQSGSTFHLYETASGCERLDYNTREWKDMPVAPGYTAVIPAMQMQYVSGGEIRALSHRVVATEETHAVGRSAIVCFIRLADTPVYDKAAHGRLQERTPGFNYDMPAGEFNTLFTQ